MRELVYDIIEDTDCVATRTPLGVKDEYKAVIDEVEKLILEKFPITKYPKRGVDKKIWYYKQNLLKERGIDWKTPM